MREDYTNFSEKGEAELKVLPWKMKPEKANKSATFKKKRKQNMEGVASLVINYKSMGFLKIEEVLFECGGD